jgi:adenine/guanine phosphoribosyltransferase-like PRPP-binding protein
MITKQQYVEYLICTIGNYTSSNRAEHLDDVSHDVITEDLMNEGHTARGLWELVVKLIQDSPEAFMLVDVGKTLYQTKDVLLSDYLRAELATPRIHAFLPA